MDQRGKKLIVIGAGGHGCVVAEAALAEQVWDCVLFLDDERDAPAYQMGCAVVGKLAAIESLAGSDVAFVVAVGDNAQRVAIAQEVAKFGVLTNVIAPSAVVSPSAKLGPGSVVLPGAILNAGCVLEADVILNTGATVDHGCHLARGVHIAPGAHIGGDVKVGARSWIGIGASVVHGVRIGADVIVGASAAVVDALNEPGVYVGVPARRKDSAGCGE